MVDYLKWHELRKKKLFIVFIQLSVQQDVKVIGSLWGNNSKCGGQ